MNLSADFEKGWRLGVGIILINQENKIFMGERIDNRGAWQMPQGGVNVAINESFDNAAKRELYEETGVKTAKIINKSEGWYYYYLPENLQTKLWGGKFLGQKQDHVKLTIEEKIMLYLNCHERDWVPDQELIFGDECKFNWEEIYKTLRPYFNNSLSDLNQVLLADYNGKLLHNMQPLYSLIHKHFEVTNITPLQNNETIRLSCELTASKKYLFSTNIGKMPLVNLIDKYGLTNLISQKKQGFSVNTVNMWNSYAQKIFTHYFDNSRLIEDKILNPNWLEKYSQKDDLDVRYVNKLLGILALEIWYRLFITKDLNADEKLTI